MLKLKLIGCVHFPIYAKFFKHYFIVGLELFIRIFFCSSMKHSLRNLQSGITRPVEWINVGFACLLESCAILNLKFPGWKILEQLCDHIILSKQ